MARASTAAITARSLLVAAVVTGACIGFVATSPQQAAASAGAAGPELTRLLRGMALIKALIAAAAFVAVYWRLQFPAAPGRIAGYVAACTAMAAGPMLIWNMTHIVAGAVLLHAGLLAAVLLGWRDETVGVLMHQRVPARRFRPPAPATPGIVRVAR